MNYIRACLIASFLLFLTCKTIFFVEKLPAPVLENFRPPLNKIQGHCVASLLSGNYPKYSHYAFKLGRSIQRVIEIDMILLIDRNQPVTEEQGLALSKKGWTLRPAEHILAQQDARSVLYTKLQAWTLVEYESVLFLDLDTLVIGDIAPFFTYWLPKMNLEGKALASVQDRPNSFNPWWSSNYENRVFNSGVMLLKPSLDTFFYLVNGLALMQYKSFGLGDQDYLNAALGASRMELPFELNAMTHVAHIETQAWKVIAREPKILHFTWPKPEDWLCDELETENMCEMWRRF